MSEFRLPFTYSKNLEVNFILWSKNLIKQINSKCSAKQVSASKTRETNGGKEGLKCQPQNWSEARETYPRAGKLLEDLCEQASEQKLEPKDTKAAKPTQGPGNPRTITGGNQCWKNNWKMQSDQNMKVGLGAIKLSEEETQVKMRRPFKGLHYCYCCCCCCCCCYSPKMIKRFRDLRLRLLTTSCWWC